MSTSKLRNLCSNAYIPNKIHTHFGRARIPPRRIPSCNCGAMDRGEFEERVDHQCRIGCLQHVSYSATRWRTHRRRCAPGRPCRPVCPARAVRDADSHWSPLHSADVGCAVGSQSQHRLASDRKLNRLRHSHHTAIDRQHMTACNHYSNGSRALLSEAVCT